MLAGADALLVVMSFEPEHRLFMETSFTTKFLDYTAFGKPIILWGPEYCTPVRVARRDGGALVVNTPEAAEVVAACRKIAGDPSNARITHPTGPAIASRRCSTPTGCKAYLLRKFNLWRMADINVILISSVRPEPTTAASMTLYRHLIDRTEINLKILPAEHYEISKGSFCSRIIPRINQTPLHRWSRYADYLLHASVPFDGILPAPETNRARTVVLTIAYKNGCWVHQRYASRHRLPLVVRFDDWWPDCVAGYPWMRKQIERRFLALHQSAKVSICVSEGMEAALGPHPNAPVIFPIPEAGKPAARAVSAPSNPFKVCYLGNMSDYGPMLAELAVESLKQSEICFEFRGPEPRWPADLKRTMRERGQLHGFGTGEAFNSWLAGFDAYLVAMFFELEQRRRVETCFATKLLDYSALGRPIVIWGPESSSAVRWARKADSALCVTKPQPQAVLEAVRKLAKDPKKQGALGKAARRAYENEFDPGVIQKNFVDALHSALAKS